ncbi:hypothetical protein CRUP_026203 [Coryphaenoides rupestris]|nr:hypothetical protein CRUP_026203 [Coryphaenoides rupestris]
MRSLGPAADHHQHGGPERAAGGLLCREALSNKHFLKTKVGPGTYESTDFIQELARKPGSVRGVCASLDRRFREVKDCVPGPGTYMLKSSVDILLSKKTSIRGPYDLFTGPRDKSVAAGYSLCGGRASADATRKSLCAAREPQEREARRVQLWRRHPAPPTANASTASTLAQWPAHRSVAEHLQHVNYVQ